MMKYWLRQTIFLDAQRETSEDDGRTRNLQVRPSLDAPVGPQGAVEFFRLFRSKHGNNYFEFLIQDTDCQYCFITDNLSLFTFCFNCTFSFVYSLF